MCRLIFLLFACLVLPAAEAPANTILGCPIVIDDFTQGALPVTNGPFEFTHVGLPASSCAGGTRHVRIDPTPTHLGGMIPLGGGDIGYSMQTDGAGSGTNVLESDFLLDYPTAQPLDLTAGGLNDRLVFDVLSVNFMQVLVMFDSPGISAGSSLLLQVGSNVLYFSDLSPYVDFTQITRIHCYFNEYSANDNGQLTLSRIRATGNSGRYLFIDLPLLVEIGPPFPLPGPLMEAIYFDEAGQQVRSMGLGMELQSALLLPLSAPPMQFPVQMRSSDNGLPRMGGLSAGFDFVEADVGKNNHMDGQFSFRLVADSIDSRLPSQIRLGEAAIHPKSFYLPFEVGLLGPTGAPDGTNFLRMRVQIADDVPYRFANVDFQEIDALSFEFRFDILDDGSEHKAPGQELFSISFEGDNVPHSTSTPAPPVLRDALALSAAPSVLSERTLLQWSRPLSANAELRVFDLAGRLVRSLSAQRGQHSVAWDARDAAGVPVASGIYMARLVDGGQQALRKLVVVR